MNNKYLDTEVGQIKFANFFHKLEHSLTILRVHNVISDTVFYKAKDKLVKQFMSSFIPGQYTAVKNIVLDFENESLNINKGDKVDLISIDRSNKTVVVGIGEFEYGLEFAFMLNFV